MFKVILTLLVCCICCGHAGTRDIPEPVRRGYAEKFHNAFTLQCNGLSSKAFWVFKDAYQTALQAGEDPTKLNAMDALFRWYRTHGSPMILFIKEPTGDQVIHPDRTRLSNSYNSYGYNSEYGRTPEQAARIREFLFGIANTISGVFCVVVGGGIISPAGVIGLGLVTSGVYMMFNSLNNGYADYERAKADLQAFEAQMKKACEKDN